MFWSDEMTLFFRASVQIPADFIVGAFLTCSDCFGLVQHSNVCFNFIVQVWKKKKKKSALSYCTNLYYIELRYYNLGVGATS